MIPPIIRSNNILIWVFALFFVNKKKTITPPHSFGEIGTIIEFYSTRNPTKFLFEFSQKSLSFLVENPEIAKFLCNFITNSSILFIFNNNLSNTNQFASSAFFLGLIRDT